MTTWVDTEIKVSLHRSLNSSRGVIRCRDFRDCDDHEVMDALRSQGVIDVKHIQAKTDNVLQPTNTFILTFSSPSPPKFIKATYMRIPVELYVPNPLRCYQCQRFGYGKISCQRPAVCVSYAKATVSATKRATQSVEIQTDFTWPQDCKFPMLYSSVFQPLAGGHSKVSDVAASAAQTDSVDNVFVEAGGQPLAPFEIRTPQTGDKLWQPEKKTINHRPRPVLVCRGQQKS